MLLWAPVFSQNKGEISGVVIDNKTNIPVEAVNVYLKAMKIGTYTDREGRFKISFSGSLKDYLIISHVSYNLKEIPLKLKENEKKYLEIKINQKILNLKAIDVIGSSLEEQVFNAENFINIVPREIFKEKSYENTSDILKGEPGILVQKTTYGHGSPIIRGLIGKYVLLLFNGVRLNKPTFRFGANQYLNTILPEALDNIMVTRGPTSVAYGSDAIGGTINLIPRIFYSNTRHFQLKPEVMVRLSTADKGKNYTFKLEGGNERFSFTGVGGYKDIGDLRAGKNVNVQSPTGWSEIDGNINLRYTINANNSLDFNYLLVNQKEVPRYDKYVTGQYQKYIYEPQKRRLSYINYNYKPVGSWISDFQWNVSYQQEHEGKTLQKTGSSTVKKIMNRIYTIGTFACLSSIVSEKHIIKGGIEYYRDIVRSSGKKIKIDSSEEIRGDFPDKSIYNSGGIYIKDEYLYSKKLNLTAGLRYSYFAFKSPLEAPWGTYSQNFGNLSGLIGLSYKPDERLNITCSYSRGFRAPNFNDTVVLKVSNSGVDAPSPYLKPEISNNFELGLKINDKKLAGGMFLFYNRLTNLIERKYGYYQGLPFFDENNNGIKDKGEVPIFQKFNTGKSYICGSELYFSFKASSSIILNGNCFYTYGENISLKEPMSRIPPFMGKFGIRWYKTRNLWIETFLRFATKQDRLSQRDILDTRIPEGGTPGYKTVNIKGGIEFSSLKLNIIFENIFDELYKEHGSGIYSPGRNLSISINVVP